MKETKRLKISTSLSAKEDLHTLSRKKEFYNPPLIIITQVRTEPLCTNSYYVVPQPTPDILDETDGGTVDSDNYFGL